MKNQLIELLGNCKSIIEQAGNISIEGGLCSKDILKDISEFQDKLAKPKMIPSIVPGTGQDFAKISPKFRQKNRLNFELN